MYFHEEVFKLTSQLSRMFFLFSDAEENKTHLLMFLWCEDFIQDRNSPQTLVIQIHSRGNFPGDVFLRYAEKMPNHRWKFPIPHQIIDGKKFPPLKPMNWKFPPSWRRPIKSLRLHRPILSVFWVQQTPRNIPSSFPLLKTFQRQKNRICLVKKSLRKKN